MKKLQVTVPKPEGPVPEAYKEFSIEHQVPKLSKSEHLVPPKSVYSYNLKKIKSFKQIRRKYRMSNQEAVFVKDLGVILSEYLPQNHQLDKELLLHILNIAESFFIYGCKKERNELKRLKMEA